MVTHTLDHFIDDDFRQWLIWYWSQLPDKQDTGQRYRAFLHHRLPWTQRLLDKLESMIRPYESNFWLSTAYLAQDYAPGGIHSDGWIADFPEPGHISRTYLIPLQITGNHATLVFDQSSPEAVTFNAAQGLENRGIVNYKQVEPDRYLQLDQTRLAQSIYDQYLSHLDFSCVKGLSLADVMHWRTGAAISWPRERYHCSANFQPGLQRISLILMTCTIT